MSRLKLIAQAFRFWTAAVTVTVVVGVAACSGSQTTPQGVTSAPSTTVASVATDAALSCNGAEANGSDHWSTAELVSLLQGQDNTDAVAALQGIKGLPFQPNLADDAIRAWLFTADDQVKAKASATRLLNGLSERCSFAIVDDVAGLKGEIPRLANGKITHAGDLFGFCPLDDRELGWIKFTRIYSCKNEIMSVDFKHRKIGYRQITPEKNSEVTSYGVSGSRVVWVTTAMNPAKGLEKTTFDATIHTSGQSLESDTKTVMYQNVPAGEDPYPTISSTQEGFILFWVKSPIEKKVPEESLWDLTGNSPVEIPNSTLPKDGQGFPEPDPVSLQGLMPLYQAKASETIQDLYGVYFDTVHRKVLKGMEIGSSDGGCGDYGVGETQTHAIDAIPGTTGWGFIDPHQTFFLAKGPSRPTGVILKDDQDDYAGGDNKVPVPGGVAATGMVIGSGNGGLSESQYLKRYDGKTSWSIDPSVANFEYMVMGRMRMKNTSGEVLYVNPNTGKEDSSLSASNKSLLWSYDGPSDHQVKPNPDPIWDHDDTTTILAENNENDVYILSRKAFCNLGAGTPGTSEVAGLLSKSFDQQR